jgi:guanyl-specific ribonuclease Sa
MAAALAGCGYSGPEAGTGSESRRDHTGRQGGSAALPAGVPEKVAEVLASIEKHDSAPAGYEGGRTFHNEGRGGEQVLPRRDGAGRPIHYREWDVNPRRPGVNRGPERLVTGSDGSAYYTADHYRTFTKIK